jgi:hypothetical protein
MQAAVSAQEELAAVGVGACRERQSARISRDSAQSQHVMSQVVMKSSLPLILEPEQNEHTASTFWLTVRQQAAVLSGAVTSTHNARGKQHFPQYRHHNQAVLKFPGKSSSHNQDGAFPPLNPTSHHSSCAFTPSFTAPHLRWPWTGCLGRCACT